jgi:hypothetical protein
LESGGASGALHPTHWGGRFIGIDVPGHEGGQPGDKVQRFQHHAGRTIMKRLLVAVHDPAAMIDAEALGGDGRPGDVPAQAFQARSLPGLA